MSRAAATMTKATATRAADPRRSQPTVAETSTMGQVIGTAVRLAKLVRDRILKLCEKRFVVRSVWLVDRQHPSCLAGQRECTSLTDRPRMSAISRRS